MRVNSSDQQHSRGYFRAAGMALTMAVAGTAIVCSQASLACPPPQIVETAQLPDESDDHFYDRLISNSFPTTWIVFVATPPTQNPSESAAEYAARLAIWRVASNEQHLRARDRDIARQQQARQQIEFERWSTAPQILLVELSNVKLPNHRDNFNTDYQFRIVDRYRGNENIDNVVLSYPATTNSCGPFYPTFTPGERYVLFSENAVINADTLIGFYTAESALDERTIRWLRGTRPDGVPMPARQR